MNLRKIRNQFKKGSVCVTGMRGSGKDMLIANVVARNKKKYISNVDYTGDDRYIPFNPTKFECGKNTYKEFIEGDVKRYEYPYEDGVDLYISDVGVYFPSQYCNELDKHYKFFPIFLALSRQLGDCNVHINVQNLNRCWNKMREQSDLYIMTLGCKVLFNRLVIQKVRLYEMAESCEKRIPLYQGLWCLPLTETWMYQRIRRNEYYVTHGRIKEKILIYWNKSKYDTRIFKEILKNGKEKEN